MKTYYGGNKMTTLTKDIRNIALVGHSETGKTIMADAFLLNDGKINRLGSIREGTSTSDHTPEEFDRQISLRAALLHVYHNGVKINLLDAPGYIDFSGELRAVTHVADAAVLTVDGASGIEIGTEIAWNALEERHIPPFFAVTMLDKEHTDFDAVVQSLQDRYGDRVFPTQFPVNEGPAFTSIVDVLKKNYLFLTIRENTAKKRSPGNIRSVSTTFMKNSWNLLQNPMTIFWKSILKKES
ncbi:MAG: GTP-binding protein [Candidatus Marinimicrobia bacterium]|nr:GTP-binding protein [Candidatus Neomarinimicrobiota bacterium]